MARYRSDDEDNFTQVNSESCLCLNIIVACLQVGIFWREVLKEDERERLVQNIAGHMKDAQEFIQKRAVCLHGLSNATFQFLLS